MRVALGLVAFHALLLLPGAALLYAIRLLEWPPRPLLAGAGAAHLAGVALVSLPLIALLSAGAAIGVPTFAAVSVISTLVLTAAGRWRRRQGGAPVPTPGLAGAPLAASAVLAAVVVLFVALQIGASRHTATAWDAAHNWTLKAVALSHHGELLPSLFDNRAELAAAHFDYPILQPVLGSMAMRFADDRSQGLLLGEYWLLLLAFVGAGAFLLRGRSRTWLGLLPLATLAGALLTVDIVRGDADATMGCFVGAGALALGRWQAGGPAGLLVLGALLLGAAANVKNEGLALAAVVMAVTLVIALLSSRRAGLAALATGVAVLALVLPWRAWVQANGPFARDVTPLGTSLDVGFLGDRLSQLTTGLNAVARELVTQGGWLVPAFIGVAAVCLLTPSHRRLAAFWVAIAVGAVLPVLWVYWTSTQPDVPAHIQRTSIRTVIGPIFLAAAGLAQLLVNAAPRPERPDAATRAASDAS